jgi:predicted dehydrogenase
VGVVGVGWGSLVHVPAFRLVDGFTVAALCGRTPRRLERAAVATGITDTATDWEWFVRRDDLDVIAVATPVELHHPIALAALAAGKHVLVEKPLTVTPGQARELVRAAEDSAASAITCFELRWTPERALVRSLVGRGVVGTPYSVRVAESLPHWHPSRPPQALWMYALAAGGGYLNGVSAHDIDFVCSLFGAPLQVCADVRTSVPSRTMVDGSELPVTADDTSAVLIRLASGALAVISTSAVGLHTTGAHFDVFGSNGTIVGPIGSRANAQSLQVGTVDDPELRSVAVDTRSPASGRALPERGAAPLIRAMALMLEDWAAQLTGSPAENPLPTLRDGFVVQSVIEAARRSAAGGGWVDIDCAIAVTP